jgi:hypothetical protein
MGLHMDIDFSSRYYNIIEEGLSEMVATFTSEIGQKPSLSELFEILCWELKACPDDCLEDVSVSSIVALKLKMKRGGKISESPINEDVPESATSTIEDLNDNIFVIANDLLSGAINAFSLNNGRGPSLKELCGLLWEGLKSCENNILRDVDLSQVLGISAEIRKQKKISSKVGDLVAIPAKDGKFFAACILAKNCFGTAYGIFDGTYHLRFSRKPLTLTSPRLHPIYSDNVLISSGRWQIINHSEELLSRFPAEPEIYHIDQILEDGPKIGRYGSGETPSGIMRDLTKEESGEIGLLTGKYNQVYTGEDLEIYLSESL